MPKSLKSTQEARKSIYSNDIEAFKQQVPDSFVSLIYNDHELLNDAIALGRNEIILLIVNQLRTENKDPFLHHVMFFNNEKQPFNKLQYAFLRCNVEAIEALVKLHNEQNPIYSIEDLLLNKRLYDETGHSVLWHTLNIFDSSSLIQSYAFESTYYKSPEDVRKVTNLLKKWDNLREETADHAKTRQDEGKSTSSDESTDAETSSIEGRKIIDLVWTGPVDKIVYLCALIGPKHFDGTDPQINDAIQDCQQKVAMSDDVMYWKMIVEEKASFARSKILSFEIDPEEKRPIITIEMTNRFKLFPHTFRLAYAMDSSCGHVLKQAEIAQNAVYARKSSVDKIKQKQDETETNVRDLTNKFDETPHGMHLAIIASLSQSPELQKFYSDIYVTIVSELKKLVVKGKQYFVDTNYEYKIAIAAISLLAETQGTAGNVVASGVKAAGNLLVSYHASKQDKATTATFRFAANKTTDLEGFIAVCVANAIILRIGAQLLEYPDSFNAEQIKPALVSVLRDLHKDKIKTIVVDDNNQLNSKNGFDHIADEIVKILRRKPQNKCIIS